MAYHCLHRFRARRSALRNKNTRASFGTFDAENTGLTVQPLSNLYANYFPHLFIRRRTTAYDGYPIWWFDPCVLLFWRGEFPPQIKGRPRICQPGMLHSLYGHFTMLSICYMFNYSVYIFNISMQL